MQLHINGIGYHQILMDFENMLLPKIVWYYLQIELNLEYLICYNSLCLINNRNIMEGIGLCRGYYSPMFHLNIEQYKCSINYQHEVEHS